MINNIMHSEITFPSVPSCPPETSCVACAVGVVNITVVTAVWRGTGEEREMPQVPGPFGPSSGCCVLVASMIASMHERCGSRSSDADK